jgi:molecular chaperone HscB
MDPFATLGLTRSYDVDLAGAERAHRELLRALHPDRYAGASPSERRDALTRAVEVNEAWRIVRDPVRRAESLLALAGVKQATDSERDSRMDADFLMDMLEQREELAQARDAADRDRIRTLAQAVQERARQAEQTLSVSFSSRAERWDEAAVRSLGALRFYRRFLDEVSAIEEDEAGHGPV